jgi:hypothetical protein
LDLLDPVTRFCDESLPASSVYGFLFRERDRLFPDEMFSDLFGAIGRRSIPPSVVATVMVLQRLEGLSRRLHRRWSRSGTGRDARGRRDPPVR